MGQSALEKFHQGTPLNEELAEIQRSAAGASPGSPVLHREAVEDGAKHDAERELTRVERLHLKELRQADGWVVLQRLLERTLFLHRKSVISMSQSDPLGNAEKIAQQWAYLNALRAAAQQVTALVDAEVKALDEESKQ